METLKKYDICFRTLSIGNHLFDFRINEDFFKLFTFDEQFEQPDLDIHIELEKNINFLLLNFEQKGTVVLTCDYSLDKFEHPLTSQEQLLVKFGESFNDQNDQILTIPYGEARVNVAKYIYQLFMLSLPKIRIHPEVQNGKSHSKVLEILAKHSVEKIPYL
ncbi:YceD family protein [Bacteroidetes bacterium endosymbiont of Geopemphigus sp.]|uniref:YceD family protein n=1 Tax=Bacteroidetes bacterium endosymbiont of Geopemphigus sp. TaxID=2047937 RepID=UPI000CCFF143|nr:DUF177 domain-containing protein [Bacteroidetes bacterium endosymbiont of Geopemphigus sp.]